MRDVRAMCGAIAENDYIGRVDIDQLALGTGAARLKVDIPESVFYSIVGAVSYTHLRYHCICR